MEADARVAATPAGRSSPLDVDELLDRQRSSRLRVAVLVWSSLVMFFDGYDVSAVGYVIPSMTAALGVGQAAIGSAIGAGFLGFMVGGAVLGDLGDRFGRRRVVVAGVAAFGLLTLACAAANSLEGLIILRFLAGIGLGGALPNAIALNMEFAPARARATAVGIMFVCYTLGGAAPGWVAAWLLPDFGWRSVFVVGGVLTVAVGVLLALFLPESVKFLASRPSRRAELLPLLRRLRPDLDIPDDAHLMLRERARRGQPLRLLFTEGRAGVTLLVWTAFVSNLLSLVFIINWTPTLIAGLGVAPNRAALIGAMFQAGGAVGSLVVTRLLDRMGPLAAAAALVLSTPFIVLAGRAGQPELVVMALLALAGFFAIGGQVGINALAGLAYSTSIRSTGVGWAFSVGRIGSIAAASLGGLLISLGFGVPALFAWAAVPLLIAGAAAAGLMPLIRR